MDVRYIRMNPSGNITCLVLSPVAAKDRPRITAALMEQCEQVGYLTAAADPRAAARLQMMGGEFCGNASMATAAYLASREERAGEKPRKEAREMLLEVSGAGGPIWCRVCREETGWQGMADMPLPLDIREAALQGHRLKAVIFPGMVHLIREGELLPREEAETLVQTAGERFQAPAAGLMQWERTGGGPDEISGTMSPLVWVRDSGTLVWENACGSGTSAIAAAETAGRGGPLRVCLKQPGGILRAETEYREGKLKRILLSGRITMERERVLRMGDGS